MKISKELMEKRVLVGYYSAGDYKIELSRTPCGEGSTYIMLTFSSNGVEQKNLSRTFPTLRESLQEILRLDGRLPQLLRA